MKWWVGARVMSFMATSLPYSAVFCCILLPAHAITINEMVGASWSMDGGCLILLYLLYSAVPHTTTAITINEMMCVCDWCQGFNDCYSSFSSFTDATGGPPGGRREAVAAQDGRLLACLLAFFFPNGFLFFPSHFISFYFLACLSHTKSYD
jgi:hypothetical protein